MSEELALPTLQDIEAAHQRIESFIHRTPVLTSELLNKNSQGELFFKAENLQKVGAFKARGASNAVLSLSEEAAAKGVATHSSGNHGAALAMAAAKRGIPAHIVVPENAPAVKKAAVASYGANVVECVATLPAREEALAKVVEETGATSVHPYNNPFVIAGQGTTALEILEQVKDLDVIMAPVGGGGLLAGISLAAKSINPNIRVIGVEPAGADDAFRSFGLGQLQPQTNPQTIADGLRTSLGELNFALIQKYVDTIVTVEEETIIKVMRLLWTRLKTVVEPSGAVSYAGALEHPEYVQGRRVAMVLTGGNVDLDHLPW